MRYPNRMRLFFPFAILLVSTIPIAAHNAYASPAESFAQWQRLRDPVKSDIRFAEGAAFLKQHPGWPQEKLIRIRTEAAAMLERPTTSLAPLCNEDLISGRGMIACVNAGIGSDTQQQLWIRQAWRQGDFNEDEESRILEGYGKFIDKSDHLARMDRLLYEGKSNAAMRQLSRLPEAARTLFEVRLYLMADDARAPGLVEALSPAQARDPGILYERLRWRKRHEGDMGELLLQAQNEVPHPELWWPMREAAAREAIADKHFAQALMFIEHHGELEGENLAEALWLVGWVHLHLPNGPREAYKQFYKLYTSVHTPVSRARAAYWAARAATINGNPEIAHQWWEKAAQNPTVFYGQLAYVKLHPGTPLTLPQAPTPSKAERDAFNADERVAVMRMLAKQGDDKTRDLFIASYAARATTPGQFVLLANLAGELGGTATGVEVSKLALRNNVVIISKGWPKTAMPPGLPLEPALTLAITRQESQFDPKVVSPAGARGLMQLLPATAKQVAKRYALAYSEKLLENPSTNLTLGSNYLGQLINGWDNSYVLGIASYNAGPANVRKWVAQMGTPPKSLEPALDWIESIPFDETRNYVMRVIENANIYRSLLQHGTPVAIERDILR